VWAARALVLLGRWGPDLCRVGRRGPDRRRVGRRGPNPNGRAAIDVGERAVPVVSDGTFNDTALLEAVGASGGITAISAGVRLNPSNATQCRTLRSRDVEWRLEPPRV